MPWGAPEIPKKKWINFFKVLGLDKTILHTSKNERCVTYNGHKIGFSVIHNTEAMKISYIMDVIEEILKINGYIAGGLDWQLERKRLRKVLRDTTGY